MFYLLTYLLQFRTNCFIVHFKNHDFTVYTCAFNIYYPILIASILSIIVDRYFLLSHTAFNILWQSIAYTVMMCR